MNSVWKPVILCGVILTAVFDAGHCQRTCETMDTCFGSTEYSQFYYKTIMNSPKYLSEICENSNPVKVLCHDKSDRLPQDAFCGQVISDEIITGPKTRINEFPWMALLQYTDGETIETHCQGTLISNDLVLTIHHCIRLKPNGLHLTSVRLGEWDKTTVIDCDNSSGVSICNNPPIDVPIEKTIINENFCWLGCHFTITALIRLKHKVEFTDFIKPICLPNFVFLKSRREFHIGRKFEIASWGETSPKGKKSDTLLKVDLESVACPSGSDDFLCIPSTRKRNVCDGDAGAPIMGRTRLGNRTFVYLAGIVSYDNPCLGNERQIFLAEKFHGLSIGKS